MSSASAQREVMVFPTELSRRRWQQERVLQEGWVDAARLTTRNRLQQLCLTHARKAGLLSGLPCDAAQQLLLLRRAVSSARKHFDAAGPLAAL
ncbi:MAG: hypothetical protein K9M45_01160, partial [Kiritimatiellales bacterium]|nr:hypothetical protein [Kiritimatiellales bacterium]